MREITFQRALEEAVAEEMRRDPRVFTMATDFTGILPRSSAPPACATHRSPRRC
jgi:hypothetical protein